MTGFSFTASSSASRNGQRPPGARSGHVITADKAIFNLGGGHVRPDPLRTTVAQLSSRSEHF